MTLPLKEREPFLRAIIEAPDDDAVRLVYSDWLEEQGESTRAEFIRASLALAKMEDADPARAVLEQQVSDLEKSHGRLWLEQLGLGCEDLIVYYSRGLVHKAYYFGPRAFFATANRLFAVAPIQTLTLHSSQGDFLGNDGLVRLAAMPELARLHTLLLYDQQGIDTPAWSAFFHSAAMENLTTLGVPNCALLPPEVIEIANARTLTALQRLDLGYNSPGVAGCRALISSPQLRQLRQLYLEHCFFGMEPDEDGVIAELEDRFDMVCLDSGIED